ncbi:hypothetical protein QBC34DRAFT_298165 [Podospora aff. communis PSN243]|uniref:Uncharacterized protein n=1 Tax=Podospora aff. communis PSN243 TaxID=3040156 RepID=A0AAV9GMN6_9PEZI|nr:hypothetical protein QBC34DRAFT_298165 [Podospora aff. communis PSN243]
MIEVERNIQSASVTSLRGSSLSFLVFDGIKRGEHGRRDEDFGLRVEVPTLCQQETAEQNDPRSDSPTLPIIPTPAFASAAEDDTTLGKAPARSESAVDDAYNVAFPIPGKSNGEKRYPNAKVESKTWSQKHYNERFAFVAGEMNRAVNSHPDLRERSRSVSYAHEMVGTSPGTARPCIIVFCVKEDFKSLRALFNNRVKNQLYCRANKRPLSLGLFRGRSQSETPPVPPFELIYYRTNYDPVARKASEIPIITGTSANDLTWCGGVIRVGSRTATLGLTIQIDGFYGILTVDHLFPASAPSLPEANGRQVPQEAETVDEPKQTLLEHTSDTDELGELWLDAGDVYLEDDNSFDDDDYLDDDGLDQHQAALAHGPQERVEAMAEDNKADDLLTQEWESIPPHHNLDDKQAYLDWSLVKPSRGPPQRANLFFPAGESDSAAVVIEACASEPLSHRAPVYMLSGVRGLLSGHILKSSAMIGSGPGRELCEVWTVILDHPSRILEGECGSLVIDQMTHKVYGHVVAAGPCGHTYVVPLVHVFAQIKTSFGADEVTIYGPPAAPPMEDVAAPPLQQASSEEVMNASQWKPARRERRWSGATNASRWSATSVSDRSYRSGKSRFWSDSSTVSSAYELEECAVNVADELDPSETFSPPERVVRHICHCCPRAPQQFETVDKLR